MKALPKSEFKKICISFKFTSILYILGTMISHPSRLLYNEMVHVKENCFYCSNFSSVLL